MSGDQTVTATPDECAALARRFGYVRLDRLDADYRIVAEGRVLHVTGRVRAALAQPCIATGEPVEEVIDAPFTLRFEPEDAAPPARAGEEVEYDIDALDIIPYADDRIDMGEAVAETLALSVDPYPRSPDAQEYLRNMGVLSEDQAGPFAALAALKQQKD